MGTSRGYGGGGGGGGAFGKVKEEEANSKHWFTTFFRQPLPYLITP